MARSSWEGYLRLSLISVPVKAYNAAASGGGDIHLHQIHAKCGSRIRYQKTCPIHGEVSKEEIVSGYEYDKDQYVLIKPQELDKLRTQSDKAITIDAFVRPETIDPVYFNGRTYYLVPDGPAGQKPYAVLHDVMAERRRYAVAQAVISRREETVLIRPLERLLAMTLLSYESQVTQPAAFEGELAATEISEQEAKLAGSLIDASTDENFDFARYKDQYTERLTKLIEAKSAGKKVAAPRRHEEPVVINLMDALRKSLDRAQHPKAGRGERRQRKPAGHQAAHATRKKTG